MRTIALVVLASTATSVISTCAGENFLSKALGITVGTSDVTVTTTAEFKYCNLAAASTVCCTKDTYLGFQDKADKYIAALEELAGERDQYILDKRGEVLDVRDSLNRIVSAIAKAGETNAAAALLAEAFVGSFADAAEDFTTNFDTLKANFIKYQTARATCMEELVEKQASAWCLACGNDFGNQQGIVATVGSESVDYAASVGTDLATACFDYITYSAGQSAIISLYATKDVLSSLASAVEKFVDNDLTGAGEALLAARTALTKATLPTAAIEKPVDVPTLCTSATSCSWLTSDAFVKGVLKDEVIIQGGSLSSLLALPASERLLEGVAVEGGRNLAGTWTPVASGVTISFDDNPGNVDNDQNSAVRNGVVACAIAALALIF